MTREELEHAIRAVCDLTGDDEVMVFGSQAILGQFPDAPLALRQSAEADMTPKHAIEKLDLLDAMLGEGSDFHRTHGFYIQGVPILETAVLPSGWERRAVMVKNANTRGHVGWCLEAHDLAASKLVAFREKDLAFVRVLLAEGLVRGWRLRQRIQALPTASSEPERNARLLAWLAKTLREIGLASS